MADVTTTPIAVAYRDEGFLNAGISASATTVTIAAIYKYPSGVKTKQGLNSTGGYAEISLGGITEVISFGASAVDATTKVTTWTDVRRGLSQTATSATFTAGTGRAWPKGARVRVIDYSAYLNATAFTDKANSFTDHQMIAVNKEQRFADSATAIWDDGTDLNFKSSAQATRTLSQLASLSGSNDKFKVSADDTTENYAASKLTGGDGISVTETGGGGNETLDFDVELASDPGLEFSSGALRAKVSTGITRDSNGLSVDTTSAALRALAKFFGDGSDGALTVSSSQDLDPTGDFHYTTLQVDASQTLGVSSANTPLIIRVQGNVTINGTIDLNGEGGAGTAGGGPGVGSNAATAGNTLASGITTGAGGAATSVENGRGGGGGGSVYSAGTAGGNSGGSAGAALSTINALMLANAHILIGCGGGGSGGGGDSDVDTAGAGGAGGGALLMYIGGNLTLGADSVIRADGVAGGNSTPSDDAGGGGGGGGGTIVIIVGGTITDNGLALSAAAGSGGTSGNAAGGAGGAGKAIIVSLSDGSTIVA